VIAKGHLKQERVMTIPMLAVYLLLAATAVLVAWRYSKPLRERARAYVQKVQTCGYLAPPPTPQAVLRLRRLAKALIFIQVGKIKIIGKENLSKVPGPYIVTPNHPHWADTAALPILMDGPARYMAARGVFTFGWGLGGLLVGPMGAFCADLTRGKGGPAKDAAVEVLTSGQRLVMFPEGWAYLDGKLGEFKKGAVRIAREAAAKLNKPTYIVPVNLRYGKYPGSWITKLPPPIEYLLVFLLFIFFRRGLTMVVGEPIAIGDFSTDDATATEQLKQEIIKLDPAPEKFSVRTGH
jgi:1-acyl-sn-glycerol-3-phosphate acyltransferase